MAAPRGGAAPAGGARRRGGRQVAGRAVAEILPHFLAAEDGGAQGWRGIRGGSGQQVVEAVPGLFDAERISEVFGGDAEALELGAPFFQIVVLVVERRSLRGGPEGGHLLRHLALHARPVRGRQAGEVFRDRGGQGGGGQPGKGRQPRPGGGGGGG